MVSLMGDNYVGDIVDGNVTSKVGDIGDNGGMACGGEVFGGGVETRVVWKSWGLRGILGCRGSLINGTTKNMTTSLTNLTGSTITSPITSPSPLTSDRLHPNCSG